MTDAPSPAPPEPPPTGADPLPRHTTPTWEVELLISGVAVFAMLQLPGWLDDHYFDLLPRFDADWQPALMAGYLYLRITALILAITFVLHLLSRAYWIALVGLHSVYPDGVRWDRVRLGPLLRDIAQRRMGSFAEAIEQADNRATIVFATGVQMAMLLLKIVAIFMAIVTFYIVLDLFVHLPNAGTLVMLTFLIVILPFGLALSLDKRLDRRLAADGALARILSGVLRGYTRIGFGYNASPGMLIISSNQKHRLSPAISAACLFLLFAVTLLQVDANQEPFSIGNYGLLPKLRRDAGDSLDAVHYDDQRDSQHPTTTPYIQSQIVADPYLRLTIPIDPSVHNPALRQHCAAVSHASSDEALQRHEVLACLAALHPLQLDSRAVNGTRYDLGADPKARRPALVAMIDVRGLANGRHELRIGRPADADGEPQEPDVIAFWR